MRNRLMRLFIRTRHLPPSPPSLAVPHVLTRTCTANERCRSSMSVTYSERVSTANLTSTSTHRTTTTSCPPLTHSAEHHQGTPHRRSSALHTASFDLQEPAVTRGDWQAALAPYQHSQLPPNTPTGTPPTHPPPPSPPPHPSPLPLVHEASARVQAPGGRETRAPSAPSERVLR